MGEFASYRLSDFILFSETAYYRQFELYNHAIWPVHLLAMLFALLISYALWKKPAWGGRLIAAILTISWLWVAIVFLYQRFFQIHVVADWYAFVFILQALLIAWHGVIANRFMFYSRTKIRILTGILLLIISIIAYPFIALASDRNWQQFEMFALTPDPTVLATIAVFIMYKAPAVLYILPVLWLLLSFVTLSAM